MGLISDLINAGTGVVNTIIGAKATKDSNKLQEKALEQNDRLAREQLDLLDAQNKENNAIARENIAWQKDIANMNFGLQQNQFDYQKRLNQLQMEREDNAFQRQVADLQAAGFSPLMASGGSPSSPLSSGSAPQYDVSGVSSAQSSYLQLAQQYAQLKQDSMSSHRSAKVQAYQQMANTKQASSFALASLIRGISQDLNTQYWNTQNYRLNAEHTAKQNELLQEQIDTAKASRNWNIENGWRNQGVDNYLTQMLTSFMPPTEAGKYIKEVLEEIRKGNIPEATKIIDQAKNVPKEVKKAVENAIVKTNEISQNVTEKTNNKYNELKFINSVQSPSGYITNAIYTFNKETRKKYLGQFWEDHKVMFQNKIYKWQFQNLSYKQIWQFYYKPNEFIKKW